MAPAIYITGNPSRTDMVTRDFRRGLEQLKVDNPYTGNTEMISAAVADRVGMRALHMVTADPQRTPTLVMFAQADYFLFAAAPNCDVPCISVPTTPPTSTFAWNHGGIQPEIATIWLGMVGPGIENLGTDKTWADHTDVRPTMLTLLGLHDQYVHDGRVLAEILTGWARPSTLNGQFTPLAKTYKQLNAPFGQFGMDALTASTRAIRSGSDSDDSTYTSIESQIDALTTQRNALAGQIRGLLDAAAFNGQSIDSGQ